MINPPTHSVHEIWRTLHIWFTPIIRRWRFTHNDGITEGFHRKMKLIRRRAYGFRNFENSRLRVLTECGHFHTHKKRRFQQCFGVDPKWLFLWQNEKNDFMRQVLPILSILSKSHSENRKQRYFESKSKPC